MAGYSTLRRPRATRPSVRQTRLRVEELEGRVTPSTGQFLHPTDLPFAVNSQSGASSSPQVAIDAAGNIHAFWQEGPAIYGQFDSPAARPSPPAPILVTANGQISAE